MATREQPPLGAPCWTDLSTTDVEGSRRFYGELFGWEALEPNADFGGYFMFTRAGVPVAGGMGVGEGPALANQWRTYLAVEDAGRSIAEATKAGADAPYGAQEIPGMGVQAGLVDPTGAPIGIWQPLGFPGFTTLNEHGAPSWFELHTRDHVGALAFYRDVFGWQITEISDTDEFRYAVARSTGMNEDMAGINDAAQWLGDGEPSGWAVYWEVDDAKESAAMAATLGASVVSEAEQTPYGVLAVLRDPAGAEFRLRTAPG